MPSLEEWKSMTEEARVRFLSDQDRFNSYGAEAYKLAEAVAEDLRGQFVVDLGEIMIGNKGGYLLLLPIVPEENYEQAKSAAMNKHLGFNVAICKRDGSK